MKKYQITGLFLLLVLFIEAQDRTKAFEINQKLGRGINYGNMFEAPSETAWGNPWQPEYPEIIANLGFDHVRMPIRWEPSDRSSSTSPYTIESSFLARIKEVVDLTLSKGLYVIINMHHHEALYDDPDGQKDRFLAQWKQISEYFKDYPGTLLFEILNEPHGNLTADKWNVFLVDALAKIREDNPDRVVLIGTAEYGGLGGLSSLDIPDDDNIILTVHYYNPFQFTHQGASWVDGSDEWLGTEWHDTVDERAIVEQEFAPLLALGQNENIPIHIGEFGAFETADIISREKWTTYLPRYFEQLNWSWAYWEFSAGFGIYDPVTESFVEELTDALLVNEMPEPDSYIGTVIYSSDFESDYDGWVLYTQVDGVAQLSRANNSLIITIDNGSSETWHVQLTKSNFNLEEGKKYRLSFKAKSDAARSLNAYMGMTSSPWSAYSGGISPILTNTFTTYSTIFDMNVDDNNVRIAFDLGTWEDDVMITEVLVEELQLASLSVIPIENISSKIFPNPVTQQLQIVNRDEFEEILIYNIKGQILKKESISFGSNLIDLAQFKTGLYIISLQGINKRTSLKIIKF